MVIFCSDVYNLFLGGIFNITVSDVENHHWKLCSSSGSSDQLSTDCFKAAGALHEAKQNHHDYHAAALLNEFVPTH